MKSIRVWHDRRFFHVSCPVSRATKVVKTMYDVATCFMFIEEAKTSEPRVRKLVFTIPTGTSDKELELIDGLINYLIKE